MRELWLAGLLGELWHSRGEYPGLARAMNYLGFSSGARYCIQEGEGGAAHQDIHSDLFEFLHTGAGPLELKGPDGDEARRRWRYLESSQQERATLLDSLKGIEALGSSN